MSTDIGKIRDSVNSKNNDGPDMFIEVAIGTGGVRIFSTENKIWLDRVGTKKLIELLELALLYPIKGDEDVPS